jgi:2,4-dienoyl-CoA reductase-like NADH-dependent reductase (Old Yellow Enzyme family)
MPDLFDPARFSDLALAKRIVLAPMASSRNVEQFVRLQWQSRLLKPTASNL